MSLDLFQECMLNFILRELCFKCLKNQRTSSPWFWLELDDKKKRELEFKRKRRIWKIVI